MDTHAQALPAATRAPVRFYLYPVDAARPAAVYESFSEALSAPTSLAATIIRGGLTPPETGSPDQKIMAVATSSGAWSVTTVGEDWCDECLTTLGGCLCKTSPGGYEVLIVARPLVRSVYRALAVGARVVLTRGAWLEAVDVSCVGEGVSGQSLAGRSADVMTMLRAHASAAPGEIRLPFVVFVAKESEENLDRVELVAELTADDNGAPVIVIMRPEED